MSHNISDFRIVADSAANLNEYTKVSFCSAPMKIITAEKEYVDDITLDTAAMVEDLRNYTGRSSTSCPNPDEWLRAFGESKYVFAVTITSNLSGSYNAALTAKGIYESEHPERKVFLVDTLSAGPEEGLIVEKLGDLIASGLSYEEVCQEITAYLSRSGLLFMLESLKNMANNGRVSHAVAKITGFLGIRIVGRVSDHGTLEPIHNLRGEHKAMATIYNEMRAAGYRGGKVRVVHCRNQKAAETFIGLLKAEFPGCDVTLGKTTALCSFYAEIGGVMVGFEG